MRDFTATRNADTTDEIWVLEHAPVYTLGQAGKPEHVLNPGDIPVVHCDRGGQVTYHGPGQTVIYLMLDVRRLAFGSRQLVRAIEESVVDYLHTQGITAQSRPDAPGVYVNGAKIASLGLRIRRNGSYHGLAINRDIDPAPWQRINPCGYAGQAMTSLAEVGIETRRPHFEHSMITLLCRKLALSPRTTAPPDWYN